MQFVLMFSIIYYLWKEDYTSIYCTTMGGFLPENLFIENESRARHVAHSLCIFPRDLWWPDFRRVVRGPVVTDGLTGGGREDRRQWLVTGGGGRRRGCCQLEAED